MAPASISKATAWHTVWDCWASPSGGGSCPDGWQSSLDQARARDWRSFCPAARWRLLNDPLPHGVEHDVGGAVQIELLHQPAAVCFHGVETQAQKIRHFLVGFALRQKLQYFLLAVREQIVGVFEAPALHLYHVVFEQRFGDGGTEEQLLS